MLVTCFEIVIFRRTAEDVFETRIVFRNTNFDKCGTDAALQVSRFGRESGGLAELHSLYMSCAGSRFQSFIHGLALA